MMPPEEVKSGSMRIEELEISIRTYNALVNGSDVRTVEELCQLSQRELLRLPGIGPITLRQINDALAEKGHALGAYVRPS